MNARLGSRDRRFTSCSAQGRHSCSCQDPGSSLKDGHGEIDDIDHLGNRRVRSVGELHGEPVPHWLLRMERAIRERMSSVELDTSCRMI